MEPEIQGLCSDWKLAVIHSKKEYKRIEGLLEGKN
jgi:hypothetical protein